MNKNTKTKAAVRTRIRKGDEVMVIAGESKGTRGIVQEVYLTTGRVLVEGVNIRKRAYKKNTHPAFPDGGIHDKALPIAISNVMLLDPKSGDPTRVGVRYEQGRNGERLRVRFSRISGDAIKD